MTQILGRIRMPNLAAAPASPARGEMYYDTTTDTLLWFDGTQWVSGKGGAGGATEVNVSTGGPSPRVGELLWVDVDEPGPALAAATTSTPGAVQLAGDLTGTADSPDLRNFPHARMTWSGAIAATTNTHYGSSAAVATGMGISNLGFTWTTNFDVPSAMADPTNGVIKCLETGLYLVVLQLGWQSSTATGPRSANVARRLASGAWGTIGGVAAVASGGLGAGANSLGIVATGIWPCEANAQLVPTFYQNTAAALSLIAATFMAAKMSNTPTGM